MYSLNKSIDIAPSHGRVYVRYYLCFQGLNMSPLLMCGSASAPCLDCRTSWFRLSSCVKVLDLEDVFIHTYAVWVRQNKDSHFHYKVMANRDIFVKPAWWSIFVQPCSQWNWFIVAECDLWFSPSILMPTWKQRTSCLPCVKCQNSKDDWRGSKLFTNIFGCPRLIDTWA